MLQSLFSSILLQSLFSPDSFADSFLAVPPLDTIPTPVLNLSRFSLLEFVRFSFFLSEISAFFSCVSFSLFFLSLGPRRLSFEPKLCKKDCYWNSSRQALDFWLMYFLLSSFPFQDFGIVLVLRLANPLTPS